MKTIISLAAAGALALSVSACNTPGERAAGGAVIGGLAGPRSAAPPPVGRAGRSRAPRSGPSAGPSSAPRPRRRRDVCPYGVYRGPDGLYYCR
jgi:hypothetical protein